MVAVYDKAHVKACDDVHISIVEYGSLARLRFNLNTYTNQNVIRNILANWTPRTNLGAVSNAHSGFTAANLLLTEPHRGHRAGSTGFVHWVTRSEPHNFDVFENYAYWNVKQYAYVLATGVGAKWQSPTYFQQIQKIASANQLAFRVAQVQNLASYVLNNYFFSWCPDQPDTTAAPTTQPNPTTPGPNPTTSVPPSEFCFGTRQRRNNKDHYADPSDCHYYYQCFYFNESSAVGIRRQCPAGSYWHDAVLSCMPEGPVPCTDRCMDDSTAARGCYAGTGCRQFFVCANTASYGMCCPEGSTFVEASCSCEESETCNDDCVQQGPTIGTTILPASRYNDTVCQDSWGTYITPSAGENNAYYILDQEGHRTEKLYCAAGTDFDIETCRCDIFNYDALPEPMSQTRRALLWLPFNSNTNDQSINKFATFLYDGAELDCSAAAQGSCSFRVNNGHLSVPGLKSFDSRDAGSWCGFFRYEQSFFTSCFISYCLFIPTAGAVSQVVSSVDPVAVSSLTTRILFLQNIPLSSALTLLDLSAVVFVSGTLPMVKL